MINNLKDEAAKRDLQRRGYIISTLTFMHYFVLASRVGKPLHPELKSREEFDIRKVRPHYFPEQVDETTGDVIYRHLKDRNMLENCLGFEHLLAIQAEGTPIFRQYFADKTPYAWRDVKLLGEKSKSFYVPCITELKGEVLISWRPMNSKFYVTNPALLFE